MKRPFIAAGAVACVVALALTGCAQPPGQTTAAPSGAATPAPGAADFKACMVSDSGGFDDKSFNQTSHKGMTDAAAKLGIQTGQVESTNTADFAQNISAMVNANCNIIITVGFLLSDDTLAAAKTYPKVNFAIVDAAPEGYEKVKNLRPLQFNTAESSFLAGYLAAGMSQTGKVGTLGGMKIPTITIFMDGFAQGVQYHNQQKGTQVQVLGWDTKRQDGQFVPGNTPFENIQGGQQTAQSLISQGADIIMPVAGPAGEGALQAAQASGGKVNAIWVDTDGCVSAQNYCSSIVSSVYKGMDLAVEKAITDAQAGNFDNSPYVGTLVNSGTGLSGFNQFEDKVSPELRTELDGISAKISSGEITVESKAQPKE